MKIFVEIGCCYYDTLHHLLDEGWTGYMIDPIGEYLDKIPNHPNLTKIEAAVTLQRLYKTPSLELTYVTEQHYKTFDEQSKKDFHGMGSTQPFRTHILDGKIGNYNEGDVTTKVVPAISLNWLIEYFNIPKIDLLKIDTEGADFDILASIDLSKTEVSEIRIEHKHYDDIFLGRYLELNNYKWEFDPNDWSSIIAKKL